MKGDFVTHVQVGTRRYTLNRAASETLLKRLDAFGGECGEPCMRLREDLRRSLAATAPDGREAEAESDLTVRLAPVTAAPADAPEAEGGAPRCFWCEEPGEELPAAPGDTEPIYNCRTAGCPGCGRPKNRAWFETGSRF